MSSKSKLKPESSRQCQRSRLKTSTAVPLTATTILAGYVQFRASLLDLPGHKWQMLGLSQFFSLHNATTRISGSS
jgi:hypothetical protein